MVIFHSYVKLPEGMFTMMLQVNLVSLSNCPAAAFPLYFERVPLQMDPGLGGMDPSGSKEKRNAPLSILQMFHDVPTRD